MSGREHVRGCFCADPAHVCREVDDSNIGVGGLAVDLGLYLNAESELTRLRAELTTIGNLANALADAVARFHYSTDPAPQVGGPDYQAMLAALAAFNRARRSATP